MQTNTDIEDAFNKAYDDYADALFRHCVFRLSNRERALELVQDTFMKTWDTASKGTEIRNWRALLYRTLNNLIIDEYRKKKQVSLDKILSQDNVSEGNFADLKTGSLSEISNELDAVTDTETVHAALKELRDNYKQVLILRYIDGLRIKEIATVLNESQNVISVRINRALKKVKIILQSNKAIMNT